MLGHLPWHRCREFNVFPPVCRLWVAWCKYGLKRRNGATYGGSVFFRLLQVLLRRFPCGTDNLVSVNSCDGSIILVLDTLDLETYIHTVPLLARGSFEFEMQKALLAEGMTFVDAGANAGLYTFAASLLVGRTGRVLAFEPQPRLLKALELSKIAIGASNTEILPYALSDEVGTADFAIPVASGSGSLFWDSTLRNRQTPSLTVRTITLDKACGNAGLKRVDLIKLDIEGAEYAALCGARRLIEMHHPFIWFEWNPDAQKRAGIDFSMFYGLLRESGYMSIHLVADKYPPISAERLPKGLVNCVAIWQGRAREFKDAVSAMM